MQTDETRWDPALRLSLGARGPDVKRVQEWLTLGGSEVARDGDFGRLTEAALRAFQASRGLPATGAADATTFALLCAPLAAALAQVQLPLGATLGEACVAHARAHLAAGARELDERNMGPWVRAYMGGHEGRAWPWCAGFVSFVLRQAAETLRDRVPFRLSYGCSELARYAKAAGRFIDGSDGLGAVAPGDLFVVRGESQGSWSHTGVVAEVRGGSFLSVEGNTSYAGSREGTHVRSLERRPGRLDFIAVTRR